MSNPSSVLIAILIVVLGTHVGQSQWVPVNNGLENLDVQTIAIMDSSILVGTGRGVFHSTDCGDSWSNAGLDTSRIYEIATDGKSLFVLSNSGLHLSTTKGGSWISIETSGWPAMTRAASIAVRDTYLWVGTAYTGANGQDPHVFTTTDFGVTWSKESFPPAFGGGGDSRAMSPIVTRGLDLFSSLDLKGRLYRSTDDGVNWLETTYIPPIYESSNYFPDFAVEGNTIFVMVNNRLAM